jgi:hypothetical protein
MPPPYVPRPPTGVGEHAGARVALPHHHQLPPPPKLAIPRRPLFQNHVKDFILKFEKREGPIWKP